MVGEKVYANYTVVQFIFLVIRDHCAHLDLFEIEMLFNHWQYTSYNYATVLLMKILNKLSIISCFHIARPYIWPSVTFGPSECL